MCLHTYLLISQTTAIVTHVHFSLPSFILFSLSTLYCPPFLSFSLPICLFRVAKYFSDKLKVQHCKTYPKLTYCNIYSSPFPSIPPSPNSHSLPFCHFLSGLHTDFGLGVEWRPELNHLKKLNLHVFCVDIICISAQLQ